MNKSRRHRLVLLAAIGMASLAGLFVLAGAFVAVVAPEYDVVFVSNEPMVGVGWAMAILGLSACWVIVAISWGLRIWRTSK